ncbi:hypothetical protein STEG23_023997, partial [Scotinomys teguina]
MVAAWIQKNGWWEEQRMCPVLHLRKLILWSFLITREFLGSVSCNSSNKFRPAE